MADIIGYMLIHAAREFESRVSTQY